MDKEDTNKLVGKIQTSLHKHWGWFLVEGIVLIILGTIAVIVPPLATLSITLFLGWLFLINGIIAVITAINTRKAPGFGWSLLSAIASIVAGSALIIFPISGILSLTLIIIVFFTIQGITNLIHAFKHNDSSGGEGWLFVSGLANLLVAMAILIGLPMSAAWAIGLLVGINLIISGVALSMVAINARNAKPPLS
jgi:uncharacterized membrane protein HdeD (DUF308 family)